MLLYIIIVLLGFLYINIRNMKHNLQTVIHNQVELAKYIFERTQPINSPPPSKNGKSDFNKLMDTRPEDLPN